MKNLFTWLITGLILPFLILALSTSGCKQEPKRPVIRIGLGMTIEEVRAGSTYPFLDEERFESYDWILSRPYDLILVHEGKELREDNIGEGNFYLAFDLNEEKNNIVETIALNYQNRALTLDEAIATSKKLNEWFAQFDLKQKDAPFSSVQARGDHASGSGSFTGKITNYEEMRETFLDKEARIVGLVPFALENENKNVGVSLHMRNGRRQLTNSIYSVEKKDRKKLLSEREYFVTLSIRTLSSTEEYTAREMRRYERKLRRIEKEGFE